jgi:hypothetical protein
MQDNHDIEVLKTININGTNNKYQMKKLLEKNIVKEKKQRVESKKWSFPKEYFEYEKQIKIISDISNNNLNSIDDISKLTIQQINKKIYNYKQQDVIKKHYNEEKFLTIEHILYKMIECQLKCIYCKKEMFVLYDIAREMCQWTVDRINNNLGHNNDNFHLSCLECNLKRRRTNDEKFLFTKQLNIIKHE